MKLKSLFAITLLGFFCINHLVAKQNQAVDITTTENSVLIENSKVILEIEKRGGQLIDIHLKSNPVNPLSWQKEEGTMPKYSHENALYKGHFLCVGNIGAPTKAERDAGAVRRGEQTGKIWSVEIENDRKLLMGSSSPSDGMEISRTTVMHESESQILFVESFKNTTAEKRATNVLQHVTLGPPFLNEKTLINSNATSGFYFKYENNPVKYELNFPYVLFDSTRTEQTDVRIVDPNANYLTRHIFSNENGFAWVTGYDPVSGVIIGYVWDVTQYPWLNCWNASENNKPTARGIEFGTAGFNGTFEQLLADNISYHGYHSWEDIQAQETAEKKYVVFLADIGKNKDNPTLTITENTISIVGNNDVVYRSISNGLTGDLNQVTTMDNHTFRVYPNPANDRLAIEGIEDGYYILYDITGNKQLEGDLTSSINISCLKSGMYILSVNGEVKRFIKRH